MSIIKHIRITNGNPKMAQVQFADDAIGQRFARIYCDKGLDISNYGSKISFTAMDSKAQRC